MKRISEAIAEKMSGFTKSQKLLADFILEHCDKAAFMSSFELAAYTGVSQSTAIRFAEAMGYAGFAEFQEALEAELKYRLVSLERFEMLGDQPTEDDIISEIMVSDARNIKKNSAINTGDAIKNISTRMLLSSRVYIYGQGHTCAASVYLASYLRDILPNVCCINQTGVDPVASVQNIDSGDLLFCISFVDHEKSTIDLLDHAKQRGACIISISEGKDSVISDYSDVSLVSEIGEFGINGTLAPVISLCGTLISILARSDKRIARKYKLDFKEENK